MKGMPPALRRAQILDRVKREGGSSVSELAKQLGVSHLTVHRDLDRLADDGLVERVYGGVVAAPEAPAPVLPPTGWEARAAEAGPAKRAIAAHAARMVQTGSTIFLDSSTTCLALARQLVREPVRQITLVTNSPAIAYELVDDRFMLVAAPGELDQHMRLFAGRWTTEFIAGLNFELAFVSGAGLTLRAGLTTSGRPLADVINAACAAAARSIALVDASKFGRASLLTVARAQDFDTVVTDDGLAPETAAEFRAAGVALDVAPAL